MCLRDTNVRFRIVNALLLGIVGFGIVVRAQVPSASLAVEAATPWKRVGGTTIDAGLAGAASGPVAAVWYAAGTGRLLVETESARVFETADFIHWRLNTDATVPVANAGAANPVVLP